ncbi:LOB domain-containing protein 1 [Striga hermonthica]|uniref:LOB domain-containing protein 1 n=1 Tax=Striga hermonthica TaxID=68872 RepID=A0A9N7NRR3_STRHE|nr:LOB domain-containing protein 1 [Striga hermonthica]
MMISNSNSSPCAACKILRRKCVEKCVLAPYFPPNDPLKFTIAHRVFGASNIIKFLQDVPEAQRADAISSMVYEANARLRDPIYGCAGSISQLQMQVSQLQQQLAKAQAQILNLQSQHSTLISLYSMDINSFNDFTSSPHTSFIEDDNNNNIGLLLDPLWT